MGTTPLLAIYIGHAEGWSRFYTISGTFVNRRPKTIRYSVPQFASAEAAESLRPFMPNFSEYLVRDQAQENQAAQLRQLGAPLLAQMTAFWRQSEATYRQHSVALDNAHAKMADETVVRFATLSEIADRVYGKKLPAHQRTAADMYALHRAVTRRGSGFYHDPFGHRVTTLFEIRPKRELRLFRTVEHWFHEYHSNLLMLAAKRKPPATAAVPEQQRPRPASPMRQFLEKARELIGRSRKIRRPTPMHALVMISDVVPAQEDPTRPCRLVETDITFSDTDRVIIAFLRAWADGAQKEPPARFRSLGSLILRATGLYDGYELDEATGFMFLQEIGVHAPWENRYALSDRFQLSRELPQNDPSADPITTNHQRIAPSPPLEYPSSQASAPTAAAAVAGADELVDSMAHLRKDWGDLMVYCVDDEGTRHVEDGFSIEPVPGDEEQYWLHVHIAHPTAFIPPSHPIARRARRQGLTLYLPEGSWPMLPEDVVNQQLSIAPGRPVLTFSAKVNAEGVTLETQIRPGIVRRMTFVTARSMDRTHTVTRINDRQLITVGGPSPKLGRQDVLNFDQLEDWQQADLEKLSRLVVLRYQRRFRPSSFRVNQMKTVALLGDEVRSMRHQFGREPLFWEGDPFIKVGLLRWEGIHQNTDPSEIRVSTTAEMMVLASQTAAQWCHTRGIPVPFRGTFGRNAELPADSPLHHRVFYAYRSNAFPHELLGVDMYAKATSPLRRFGDMISHWQIDAALRHEAETTTTTTSTTGSDTTASGPQPSTPSTTTTTTTTTTTLLTPPSSLPFTKADVDRLLIFLHEREVMFRRLHQQSQHHWLCQMLMRTMVLRPDLPPPRFACFVLESNSLRFRAAGYVKDLHVTVTLETVPDVTSDILEVFDEYEVEIQDIDVYHGVIRAKPLQLLRKAADQSELDLWRMKQVTGV